MLPLPQVPPSAQGGAAAPPFEGSLPGRVELLLITPSDAALPPDVMLFSFHGRLPLLLWFFILCNISAFFLYLLRCFYFCACCCYQWHSNARNRFKISKKSPVWLEPLVQSLVTFQGAFKRFKSKSEMVPVS